MNFWISFHCTLLLTCYRRDGLLYWHFSPHAIMHLLYVFALSPKVFSDHSQPHHDHLLPWQLSHRTNRPPLSLSLSFSFTSCLSSAGLHFLCRDSYSPISHCHHLLKFFNRGFHFLRLLNLFFTLLSFFPLLFLFMRYLQLWENQSHFLLLASPASTVTASGRVPLQQTWRGHSSVSARFFGGFSNLPDLRLEQFGQALYAVCVKVKNFKVFCEPQWR